MMPNIRKVIMSELQNKKIQSRNFLESEASYDESLQLATTLDTVVTSSSGCTNINSISPAPISQMIPVCDSSVCSLNSDSDFDSNFEVPKPLVKKKSARDNTTWTALSWEQLAPSLQSLLPNSNGITYVITDFSVFPSEDFARAPSAAFEATIRLNVATADEGKAWISEMMDHSHCTYRHTKGQSAGMKRVLHKAEMHCQHQAKTLTPKQMKKAALARPKSSKKILLHNVREKNWLAF